MIKQFLIELKPQPISCNSLVKERGSCFTELLTALSTGKSNFPVLQIFTTSMISATS